MTTKFNHIPIPKENDSSCIMELKIGDNSHLPTPDSKMCPTEDFLIRCIGTTLIVSKKYFKDIFKLLEEGDTFKAVIDKDRDTEQYHFKYFLRIDSPLF